MHKLREDNNASKGLEHSKHTLDSVGLCFTWTVIFNAHKNAKPRKKLEASYVELSKTSFI